MGSLEADADAHRQGRYRLRLKRYVTRQAMDFVQAGRCLTHRLLAFAPAANRLDPSQSRRIAGLRYGKTMRSTLGERLV